MTGLAWVLRLDQVPDAMPRLVQGTAGLPAEPPLGTVRAWRRARR